MIGLEEVIFLLTSDLEWPANVLEDGTLDLFCLRLDDRSLLLNLGEDGIADLVNLGDVGLCVRSGSLEVRERWLDEFCVERVGDVD